MNNNSNSSFSLKRVAVSVAISFVFLFCYMILLTFLLRSTSCHEQFYGLCSWGGTLFLSLLISFISKRFHGNSVLNSLLTASLFSVISFSLSCIIGMNALNFIAVFLQYFALISLSFIITVVWNAYGGKRIRRKKRN